MATRVLVLSASIGAGHTMAADAVAAAFRSRHDVDEVAQLDVMRTTNEVYRLLYDDGYFALVKSVPWIVGWGYDKSDQPFNLARGLKAWDRVNNLDTVRAIREFAPTHVVCTHFLPLRIVSLLLSQGTLSCSVSAVTTDYDFQGLWLTGAFTRMFVAREETRDHLLAIGVPERRVTVSGIPVRAGLDAPVDRAAVLGRYGLREGLPTVLVSAGAAGGDYVRAVVGQVQRVPTPHQTLVVCGRNAGLRASLDAQTAGDPCVQVLGYTSDMGDLLRATDLFVGKPGGLSSSECMAAGLPMVLINPIPGQEVRNSDYLLEEGAAVRCNYETTVGSKIERLLAEPGRLPAMAAAARRIGHPRAAQTIAYDVLHDADQSLWITRSAQKAMLRVAEAGHPLEDAGPRRTLAILADARTSMPVAVVTDDEVRRVDELFDSQLRDGEDVEVALDQLSRQDRLKIRVRPKTDPHLLLVLRRLIGDRAGVRLNVERTAGV
ncbi:MGDG synthase family glycosyltransferase [Microlunatus flavus]|uniref:Processive 1,2-diacylglycerol beta-glucosyltransferase n=1 Tax=Microlunatus flavus TaxID=1036181 RepID=A0A1H9AKM5_9ACTN|nr:glycosyltransferase [Microlunatus flavus]SEP77027.1 processive 1,2-diacylglycerol beta-glucosyltransferase [Microlunatus flavus]